MIMTHIESGATIDDTGTYRYALWRTWDAVKPRMLWIMLNPSTADGKSDDPTIRRCVGFAHAWGYGGIDVANLYALRATDPRDLRQAQVDPVGPDNDTFIKAAAMQSAEVVCGWGAHSIAAPRVRRVCGLLDDAWMIPQCLGVTKEGHPRHPLYVPAVTLLEPFTKMVAL